MKFHFSFKFKQLDAYVEQIYSVNNSFKLISHSEGYLNATLLHSLHCWLLANSVFLPVCQQCQHDCGDDCNCWLDSELSLSNFAIAFFSWVNYLLTLLPFHPLRFCTPASAPFLFPFHNLLYLWWRQTIESNARSLIIHWFVFSSWFPVVWSREEVCRW